MLGSSLERASCDREVDVSLHRMFLVMPSRRVPDTMMSNRRTSAATCRGSRKHLGAIGWMAMVGRFVRQEMRGRYPCCRAICRNSFIPSFCKECMCGIRLEKGRETRPYLLPGPLHYAGGRKRARKGPRNTARTKHDVLLATWCVK